jgi:hypothetical protein
MRLAERLDGRFDARAVTWFLRIFGVALVWSVGAELVSGVWRVHGGELYPWRHLGIVPLYPPAVLAAEWALRAAAGLAFAFGAKRPKVMAAASRVAALVLFVAVLERYSNHGALAFLVAFYLTLAPPDPTSPSFAERLHPALGLVRAQLVIVYVFSALNKLAHGFASGQSLVNLTNGAVSLGLARPLSWATIAAELAIPLLLIRAPRAGIAAVVLMHLAFAVLVPGVASFGLTMIAMAVLFTRRA